jgi:protease II
MPGPDPSVLPRYPDAPRVDEDETVHGTTVAEAYRWLEDPGDPGHVGLPAPDGQVW